MDLLFLAVYGGTNELAAATEAANRGDTQALARLLAPEFAITFADQSRVTDLATLKDYFDQLFQAKDASLKSLHPQPEADAPTAFLAPPAGSATAVPETPSPCPTAKEGSKKRPLKHVLEWHEMHKDELLEDWKPCQNQKPQSHRTFGVEAKYIKEYIVEVLFSDGKSGLVDLRDSFRGTLSNN